MSHWKSRITVFSTIILMAFWLLSGKMLMAQVGGGAFDFYPLYYRVSNVADNDVLNIRVDPDSGAAVIGSFSPHAQPIEVLRREHNWGYVAITEQMGWVSMNYLDKITPETVGDSNIPEGLSCGGNEPFWGFKLGQTRVDYSHMDEGDLTFKIGTAQGFAGFSGQEGFVQAVGTHSMVTAIFSNNTCSDGMSDLDYGWQVDVVLNGEDGTQGFSGCCRMAVSP